MSDGYGFQKFLSAVYGMAQSPLNLQARLRDAFAGSLVHLKEDEDLPPDLRQDFRTITEKLTAREEEIPGEGSIAASARALSDREAEELARKIVHIYDVL